MYVGADRFVFLDVLDQFLVFVDVTTGTTELAGGEGPGPQEFRSVGLLSRSEAGGVVIWDSESRRISVVDVVNGSWLVSDAPGYDRSALLGNLGTRPVARYGDGTLVIRTNTLPGASPFELADRDPGPFRDRLQYWIAVPGVAQHLMLEAMSSERYSSVSPTGSRSTVDLIFGHLLLQAQVGEHLAVAQTDLGTVRIFDRSGSVTSEIPLPVGVAVSKEQVEAERDRRLAANEVAAKRISDGSTGSFDFGRLWRNRADPIRTAPANSVAPPIDHMIGDLDGRLWLRGFHPDRENEHWQVWDVSAPELLFTLALPAGEQVLDAVGDRVLVRTQDELGVDYLLVREMVEANGSEEGR